MKLRPARVITGLIFAVGILSGATSSQAHTYTETHYHFTGSSQTYHTHWDGCYKHHNSFFDVYEHGMYPDSANSTHGHYLSSHKYVRSTTDVFHEWLYPWVC